ncbi:MFS transporter [Microlunatus parietis]|uniref:MFS family permease n=1 Tax=Microlunatus parietis TaxID=682979 RepID=A0A7Y9I6E0_9ACTN|nr:MFS transporter [Microlunatus parietis]NYE71133.1 MFS family permease [Microlunatus parietis]
MSSVSTSAPPTPPGSAPGTPGRPRPGLTLAVILTVQLMLVLDATIVNVALPIIHTTFGFTAADLSWVLNAYTLAFGGLLLLGGRLGDVLGYRRTFVAGLVIFIAGSILGGAALSGAWLIGARAVQGIGAAVAAPAALALLTRSQPEGPARNRALGLFTAVSSGGGSVGLLLGGLLTSWASWRWSFLINVPIGVAALVLGLRLLPTTQRRREPFDVPGALAASVGMIALVAGFVWLPEEGLSLRVITAFALAVLGLASLGLIERRASHPLFAFRLLKNPQRVTALISFMLIVGPQMAAFFFLVQYLQVAHGYGAFASGLAFLPLTLGIFGMSRLTPRLVNRFGPAAVSIAGAVLLIIGHLSFSRLGTDTGYWPWILLPMILLGVGGGLSFMPFSARILAGVPVGDSGAAAGLMQTAQQAGGVALGLAGLIAISGISSGSGAAVPVPELIMGMDRAFTAGAVFVGLSLVITIVSMIMTRPVRTPAEPAVEVVPEP